MTKFHAALQRRKIIDELSDKYWLESKEFVTFRLEELNDYKEMFRELTREGLIQMGNFVDSLWLIVGESYNHYLKFNCEVYGEINLVLKCYSIQKLYNGINAQTVARNVRQIKEAIMGYPRVPFRIS